jgi:hypothetical protein
MYEPDLGVQVVLSQSGSDAVLDTGRNMGGGDELLQVFLVRVTV